MKYEPHKLLKGIDLTCFYQQFIPALPEPAAPHFFVSGTAQAYERMIPFFENQIDLCGQFGSSTKAILCKKPVDFTEPITPGALQFNNRTLVLKYVAELKIKIFAAQKTTELKLAGNTLHVITSIEALMDTLDLCRKRQTNTTHGALFLGSNGHEIQSTPLGDWHGVE